MLTDEFHRAKKVTLAWSSVLFCICLLNIQIAKAATIYWFVIETSNGYLIKWLVAATVAYYLSSFILIWMSEKPLWQRSRTEEKATFEELVQNLGNSISGLAKSRLPIVGIYNDLNLELKNLITLTEDIRRDSTERITSKLDIEIAGSARTNRLKQAAFNAISGAIRMVSDQRKGLHESEIRKHINWDELSGEVVAEVSKEVMKVVPALVAEEMKPIQNNAKLSLTALQDTRGTLEHYDHNHFTIVRDVERQFTGLQHSVSIRRNATNFRIYIFDLGIPLVFAILSLALFSWDMMGRPSSLSTLD